MTQEPAQTDPELQRVKVLLERLELGLDPLADPAELSEHAPANSSSSSTQQDPAAADSQPSTEIVSQRENSEPPAQGRLLVRAVTAVSVVAALGAGAIFLHRGNTPSGEELFETARLPAPASLSERPPGPVTAAPRPNQPTSAVAAKPEGLAARRGAIASNSTPELSGGTTPLDQGAPTTALSPGRDSSATEPSSSPAQSGAATDTLTRAASEMQAGRVANARAMLRAELEKSADSADTLWALARSYSPAVLAGIEQPDAGADLAEAERIYRRWHAVSVSQGLISPDVSVDTILLSVKSP